VVCSCATCPRAVERRSIKKSCQSGGARLPSSLRFRIRSRALKSTFTGPSMFSRCFSRSPNVRRGINRFTTSLKLSFLSFLRAARRKLPRSASRSFSYAYDIQKGQDRHWPMRECTPAHRNAGAGSAILPSFDSRGFIGRMSVEGFTNVNLEVSKDMKSWEFRSSFNSELQRNFLDRSALTNHRTFYRLRNLIN
jgi:hypothetical protein